MRPGSPGWNRRGPYSKFVIRQPTEHDEQRGTDLRVPWAQDARSGRESRWRPGMRRRR